MAVTSRDRKDAPCCSNPYIVEEPGQRRCLICGRVVQRTGAAPIALWRQWKIGMSMRADFRTNPGGVLQPHPPLWFLDTELGLFERARGPEAVDG